MNKLKALNEKRSDLLTKMQALNEKESFNADDQSTFETFKNELTDVDKQLDNINTVMAAKSNQASNSLSENEEREIAKNFVLGTAVMQAKNGRLDGFYAEMDEEGVREAKESGITLQSGDHRILIPTAVQQSRMFKNTATPVTAGTAAQGGNAIATELRSFVDYLWDSLVTVGLGADYIPGLVGNIQHPTESTVPEMSWGGEIVDSVQSSSTYGILDFKPKRGSTYLEVSNQALIQTSGAMQSRLARQLLNAVAVGIERAAIAGTGANNQPRGILATAGIGDVVGGTNGAAPTWAHVVDLETKVSVENALLGALGYLTNSKVRGKLKTTSKVSGQNGFIWENDNTVNGYRTGVTNLVPSNLTKGTADGIASAIIFGNFSDLMIGQWGPMEVMANPYSQMKKGLTEMHINVYIDVLVARAKSFAAMKDALTA